MNPSGLHDSTSWSLIHRAAADDESARELFVKRYFPVVRSYLAARWKGDKRGDDLNDAIQDVFVECLRAGGVLDRIEDLRKNSFRGFFYGVIRNVARTHERRWIKSGEETVDESISGLRSADESLSRVFDRAWARAVIKEAIDYMKDQARVQDVAAVRRIDLLRLRFFESTPVREIAEQWAEPAEKLHRELTKAREEFAECLREVLRMQLGGNHERIDHHLSRLRELLH